MPGLVPTDAKNQPARLDSGVAQYLNGETLKEQGETGMRLSPWQVHLPDSVLGTDNPWRPGMQKGLKLTTVQMSPHSFFGMIMQCALSSTFRAWPLQTFGVLDPDIHSLLFDIELNLRDKPGIFNPQQMTVQVGIAHDSPPFGKRVYHHLLPTENPEAPLVKGDRGGFLSLDMEKDKSQ
jgi:hypothetical protein